MAAVPSPPPRATDEHAHALSASRPVRLSLTAEGAMFSPAEQHRLLDVARAADAAGADYIDVTEHVLMGLNTLQSGQGWEMHHLEMPQTEPLLSLAAFAGATSRIGLLSAIVIAPLRPAGLLAKQAATLWALSHGRFTMGVTTSWQKDEYDALGVSFEERGQILDDTIGACRALWSAAPTSFHSPTVNFDGMTCQPRPQADERIPVWFTGKFTPRLVRRVVALGDGWMPFGAYSMTLDQTAAAIRQLRERYTTAGRDAASLEVVDAVRVVDGSAARTMEHVPAMLAAGMSGVRVHLRQLVSAPEHIPPVLKELVQRFADASA